MLIGTIALTKSLGEELFGSRFVGVVAALATAAYAPLAIWSLPGLGRLVPRRPPRRGEPSPRARTDRPPLRRALGRDRDSPRLRSRGAGLRLRAALASGSRFRTFGFGILALGGSAAVVVGSQWLYYGDPLPNTYYLKATGTPLSAMLASGYRQMLDLFSGPALAPLALLVVYGVVFVRRRPLALVLLAVVTTTFVYSIRIGGDWAVSHSSRFLVPVFPLVFVLLIGGSRELLAGLGQDRANRLTRSVFLAHALFVAWALNPSLAVAELYGGDTDPMYLEQNHLSYRYARSYCRETSESASVGVFWAGVTPYFCERYYVDLLGKSDRQIARMTVDRFAPGHSKWDWRYILDVRRPDVLASSTPELRTEGRFYEDYCEARGELKYLVRRDARESAWIDDALLCTVDSAGTCFPCGRTESGQTVFDFEDGRLDGWGVSGDAFHGVHDGEQPLPGQSPITGYRGRYLLNSFYGGDESRGRLFSPWFIIDAPALRLRVGGGRDPERLYVGLELGEGVGIVRTATGGQSEALARVRWDVYPFRGTWARIVVVDEADGPWGHILVDAVELVR